MPTDTTSKSMYIPNIRYDHKTYTYYMTGKNDKDFDLNVKVKFNNEKQREALSSIHLEIYREIYRIDTNSRKSFDTKVEYEVLVHKDVVAGDPKESILFLALFRKRNDEQSKYMLHLSINGYRDPNGLGR